MVSTLKFFMKDFFQVFLIFKARSGAHMDAQAVTLMRTSIDGNAGSRQVVASMLGDNNFSYGCDVEQEIQTVISSHLEVAQAVEATPK